MAENIAVDHIPNDELIRAYGEWSDGDWGMVMTGKNWNMICCMRAFCVLKPTQGT